MRNVSSRRELLLVASLGGVAATVGAIRASAQGNISLGLKDKRDFHTAQLVDRINSHNGVAALSRDGMKQSLALLVDRGIVNKVEAEILNDIVSKLFEDDDVNALLNDVYGVISNGASLLGEAAESIAAVAHSSVKNAAELLPGIDYPVVQTAIAHDLKGALEGAAAGAVLGSTVPAFGLSTAAGAMFGALVGGTASSVIGYLDSFDTRD